MWSLLVVMPHVGRKQRLQVTGTKHHDAIEAVWPDGADAQHEDLGLLRVVVHVVDTNET